MDQFSTNHLITQIFLAFTYSPKILNNKITARKNTGLLYIERGEYLYSFDNKSFLAKAGNVVYLPPNSTQYEYKILSTEANTLTHQIELNILDAKSNQPYRLSQNPMLIHVFEQSNIKNKFETIITNHKKQIFCFNLYADIFNILAICANHSTMYSTQISNSKISPALNYIKENYNTKIEIRTLANLCYLSESQLRRTFIKELGITPIKYKKNLMLSDACRLLISNELTISEIADILGFCDIYAFSHFFKKEKGISPSSYKTSQIVIN